MNKCHLCFVCLTLPHCVGNCKRGPEISIENIKVQNFSRHSELKRASSRKTPERPYFSMPAARQSEAVASLKRVQSEKSPEKYTFEREWLATTSNILTTSSLGGSGQLMTWPKPNDEESSACHCKLKLAK